MTNQLSTIPKQDGSNRGDTMTAPFTIQIPGSELAIMHHGAVTDLEDKFATPKGRRRINQRVAKTVLLSEEYRESKGITTSLHELPRPRQVDKDNFGTRYWINLDPTFETFLDTAAYATTVDLLYNPDHAVFANGKPLGDEMRDALKNLLDAIEIRARSEIIKQSMSKDVQSGERWLSLACGNAQPTIEAAVMSGQNPQLTLVDFNFANLRHAKQLTRRLGQEALLDARLWRDLIDPKGFEKTQIKQFLAPLKLKQMPSALSFKNLEPESFDRIEISGFMEYLPPAMAIKFLKSVDGLLKHEGLIVFDDLSVDHPQRDFYEGVLQWPLTRFRNLEESGKIIAQSGIKVTDKTVSSKTTPEGIYPIFEIRKL
jgi:SAM-dependent methyltransferase